MDKTSRALTHPSLLHPLCDFPSPALTLAHALSLSLSLSLTVSLRSSGLPPSPPLSASLLPSSHYTILTSSSLGWYMQGARFWLLLVFMILWNPHLQPTHGQCCGARAVAVVPLLGGSGSGSHVEMCVVVPTLLRDRVGARGTCDIR